jgi:acetyltransferase
MQYHTTRPPVSAHDLDAIFRPARIAVVGASDNPDRIGGRPICYLRAGGYSGELFGVNPKYDSVQGVPCVPDVSRLPEGIDLFVLAVPAASVIPTLDAVGKVGGRSAIVYGGGFAEAGARGRQRQRDLIEVAARHDLPVVGPNCLGVVSFAQRNYVTLSTSIAPLVGTVAGRVALVSQSGGFASNVAVEAAAHGARFSHLATTGNEAVLQFGDYLCYLAEDEQTDAVVGYIEGVRNGTRFTEGLAAMADAGKPVSLLHVGRSSRGAAAVGAHTALMSDATASVDAALRRYGVHRLTTFDDMVATVVGQSTEVADGGLVVATISGGTAVYIVDTCEALGIELAELPDPTVRTLAGIIPSYGSAHNPVDLTAQVVNDLSSLAASVRVLAAEPAAGNVLLFLGGYESAAREIIEALTAIPATAEGRVWLSWLGVSEQARSAARQAGIRTYADPVGALRTLAVSHRASRPHRIEVSQRAERPTDPFEPDDTPDMEQPAAEDPRQYLRLEDGRIAVDEWYGLQLLDSEGVATPRRWLLDGERSFEQVAEHVQFPCVLKMLRPHLAHRSAQGAVVTNITELASLRAGWQMLRARHGATRALVAEQHTARAELIVGVLRDPAFGMRAVLGSGGVWANELADHSTLVPPFTQAYVRGELARLRASATVSTPELPMDRVAEELTTVVTALRTILRAHPDLTEFEINPVLVTETGLVAVDALGTGRLAD